MVGHFVRATLLEQMLTAPGHGQSAEIFEPKTRYLKNVFHNLSEDMSFEFEYLSGVFPAYPDDDRRDDQRVWGYGDPERDEIKGFWSSVQHILRSLDEKGPFCGIVGFSSGAAMAAIITSLLENRRTVQDLSWMVVQLFGSSGPVYG